MADENAVDEKKVGPDPVQKVPAKKNSVQKPPAKPKAPVNADAAERAKAVIAKLALALPITATGKPLATWSQDLKSVSMIEIQHGDQWVPIWVNEEGPYKATKVVAIPSVQMKAAIFLGQSEITRPVTDRGWAYVQWVSKNSAVLKSVFAQKDSELKIRMHFIAAALPVMELAAGHIIRRATEMFEVLTASAAIKPPQARISAPRAGSGKKEEVEFVFGI
jgi:hypothetical protein